MGTVESGEPVLRWEWRIFSRSLPVEAAVLAKAAAGEPRTSFEMYLLSAVPGNNVKVRQGQIDIKHLESVDPAGLELWRPTLKASFPLSPVALRAVCTALGVSLVELEKQRTPLLYQGCRGEMVRLTIRADHWESLSFEDEDPSRVLTAVRQLGLADLPNTNYPKGLRQILGIPSDAPLPTTGEVSCQADCACA